MINREMLLIAKIIQTGDFRTIIKSRVGKTMFGSPEARSAFRYLWEYYHNQQHPGCIPKRSFFYEKFPAFPKSLPVNGVSLPELCEFVRDSAMSRKLAELRDELMVAESDPHKALDVLRDGVTRIQAMTSASNSTMLSDLAEDLIAEYDMVHSKKGMTGVPFPWQKLNKVTGGMQEEDFILMYADHKTMKSFLGLFMSVFAYRVANRRVIYYAAEMNKMVIGRRAAAAYCKLDYERVKRARLTPGQAKMFKGVLAQLKSWEEDTPRKGKLPRFYIVKDDSGPKNRGGIYQLRAEIEAFEPDVVYCDSFYRMANDYDWKVQAQLTKELKGIAEQYKIPIVGITQRNRDQSRGAGDRGMGDVGYTLAGAQETDLGFRIVYDGENPDKSVTLHFIIAAAREIKQKGFTIHFNPYTSTKWVRWLNEDDLNELTIKQREKGKKKKNVEEKGAIHRATAAVCGQAIEAMHKNRKKGK